MSSPLTPSNSPAALSPELGAAARLVLDPFRKRVRRDKHHRYSVRGEDGRWNRSVSVSAILANIEKSALIGWAARKQHEADVEAAFLLHETYPSRWPRWKFEAVFQAYVGSIMAHETVLKNAGDHGTSVHTAIEAELMGSPSAGRDLNEYARAGFEKWREWWRTAGLTVVAIEAPVAYFEKGVPLYTGTFDLLAERADGTLVLIDWKTSSAIGYQEQRLQNVAYRAALRRMGLRADVDGLLVKVPRCKEGKVETYEVKDDFEAAFGCFRSLVNVHTWRNR